MRQSIVVALVVSLALSLTASMTGAAVAGSSTIGVAVEEMKSLALGWSAEKQILDKDVYNDKDEKVGKVEDLIITPDKAVSYVIIGVGGFLGIGEHEVAVKFEALRLTQDPNNNTVVAMSATKDSLKAAPEWRWSGEGGSGTTGKGTPPPDKPTK